jgi:hypothetical protein
MGAAECGGGPRLQGLREVIRERARPFMVPLIALKAKACKTSGHSQAWSHMAANENVFMGRSKNKKAPDHSIRGCRSREAFFVDAAACQEACRNAESDSGV